MRVERIHVVRCNCYPYQHAHSPANKYAEECAHCRSHEHADSPGGKYANECAHCRIHEHADSSPNKYGNTSTHQHCNERTEHDCCLPGLADRLCAGHGEHSQ